MKKLFFTSFLLIVAGLVQAQLTGTKSIPGDYATIQAAIAALNSQGAGPGGVIFNVAVNHTETLANATAGLITATGTAADSIIFRRAPGAGLNPKITSCTTATSTTLDGIIKIAGGDYIVFDGIDLEDNPANNTNAKRFEWGYALVKKQNTAPFDGCQHVIIKNCTITMNKANANTVGIYSGNHIATSLTALTITAEGDACNNCKFFSNHITNSYSCIKLNGYINAPTPYTLYDQNNEIGVGGGNTISNYGGTAGTPCYGIFGAYQNHLKIFNNTVNGGTTSSSALYCISFNTSNAANGEIAFNTVTAPGNSSTGAVYGIHSDAGDDGTSNTISIHDNIIANCTASGMINIVYYNSNANSVAIYNNTLDGATGGGVLQAIYAHPALTTGTLDIYENEIANLTVTSASKINVIVAGGYTTTNIYQNSIHNCTCNGSYIYGISATASGAWNWNVERNNISDLASNTGTANAYVFGLYFQGGITTNTTINNNFISDLTANQSTRSLAIAGIYLATASTHSLNYNTIYLNASSSGSAFGTTAIWVPETTTTVVLRNNIFINVSTPGVTGKTVCYRRSGTSLTTYSASSNNNNFYAGTPGASNLIYYNGTNADQTIEAYKARVSPRDSESFSEETPFQNDTLAPFDLHIPTDIPTFCEGGGIIVTTPAISIDFDGNARYPNSGYPDHPVYHAAAPDVGADEFGGIRNDLTPPVISYLPLINTSSPGPRTIIIHISEAQSGIPPTLPGLPVLYWKINNAPAWNSSVGSFISGDQYSFSFGNGAVLADVVYYYICAQDGYLTPNVAVSPAEGADGLSANPPACSTAPTTPNAYRIVGTLPAGNYLIGGTGNTPSTGCTYVDITQAFADITDVVERIEVTNGGSGYYAASVALSGGGGSGATAQAVIDEYGTITAIEVQTNGNGYYLAPTVDISSTSGTGATAVAYISAGKEITGHVNFIIDTSYYWSEENAFPLHLEPVLGAGPTKTITLKPGPLTSDTIFAYSGASIFKLNGVDYFTLDGSNNGSTSKDLTLWYLPSAINSTVVWLASQSAADGATHNTIKNCIIRGSGASTYSYAVIFSGGTASIEWNYYALASNSYNTFENNTIYNARNGIVALGKSFSEPDEGLMIKNNQVGTVNAYERVLIQGIKVENQSTGSLTGNHVQNIIYNDHYHEVTGMYICNSKNMVVSGNEIHHLGKTVSGDCWPVDGILQRAPAFNTAGNPSGNIYYNNLVYDLTTIDYCGTYTVVGIHNNGGRGDKYYYNTVYLTGQLSTAGSVATCFANSLAQNPADASFIEVKNNIFFMNGYSPAGTYPTDSANFFAHYTSLGSYTGSVLDNNDLFVSITGKARGNTGYMNSTKYSSLAAWQSATLQETASIAVDPLFVSTTILNPLPGSPVLGAGVPVAGITTDFMGNLRNPTHPTIGAYENALVISGKLWNGSVSADWSNGSNWTPAGIPGASDNITIPQGTPFMCTLNSTGLECNSIDINVGAVMTMLNGSELTVYGNLTIFNGGNLTNDGTLNLKGNLDNQN